MNWREEIKEGAKNSIPIVLGYTPLGLAFGIIAHKVGLSVLQAGLMSLFVLSGSGQFIAVAMLAKGFDISTILITTLLINSRYLLFSASMAPYVNKFPTCLQTILSFGITDETYAVNISHFKEQEANRFYMLGVNIPAHLSWVVNSVLGATLGAIFKNTDKYGLNFALPAMFIALLVILINDKFTLYIALLAALLSTIIFAFTHSSANVLMATLISASVGTVIVKWKQRSTS